MAGPTYTCEACLSADPTIWTDLTSRLMGFTSRWGREDEYSGMVAGTLEVRLDNDDGALDRENSGSPYYPYLDLNRAVRVQGTYETVTYPLGYGYLDADEPEPTTLGANATLRAVDFFAQLNGRKITATYPSQAVGARVSAVLDSVGFSALMRQLSVGQLTVPGATLTAVAPLEHLDDLLKAERGTLHFGPQGNAIYRDRHWRLLQSAIGSFGAGGVYPILTPQATLSRAGLLNDVRVKRTAGVEQVAADATSQTKYGVLTYELPASAADLLPSDADALNWAQWTLRNRKDPINRLPYLDLDPYAHNSLWHILMAADVGQNLQLTHDLPGTKGISGATFYVEGVTHTVTIGGDPDHKVRLAISRAENQDWFILDSSTNGVLDTNRLAY